MNQKFNSKMIYESFFDVLKYSNYKVIKCYNLVFTKFLLTKSIGGIVIFSFILIYAGCFIIFIIKGINPLKDKLKLKIGNKTNNKNKLDNNIDNMLNDKIHIYKDSNKYLNIFSPPRRKSLNENYKITKIINEINDDVIRENLAKTVKKNKKKKKAKTSKKRYSVDLGIIKQPNLHNNSNNKINDLSIAKHINEKIIHKKANKNKDIIETRPVLDNFELNELEFNEAIKLDKRTFIQIYFGILKREHQIIFTFFSFDDYNLLYIKLVRFIFLVTTDMVLNVFFFRMSQCINYMSIKESMI